VKVKILIANWKMNKNLKDGLVLANAINKKITNTKSKKFIILPSIHSVNYIRQNIKKSILIGAQDCSPFLKGAYTGDVSAKMIKSIGCKFTLIGHSERRIYNNETNKLLLEKVCRANEAGLKIIFCVGETIEDFKKNNSLKVLKKQLTGIFRTNYNFNNLIIAYEPVWAIGTNKTPQIADIKKTHDFIKLFFKKNYKFSDIPVLYGGSVNSQNSKEIFSLECVNGGLVGGASLIASEFIKIYDTL
tara:strand:- start:881 stop:1615 length:735 start_codon:yes stop_codon:yes gene_type:complete